MSFWQKVRDWKVLNELWDILQPYVLKLVDKKPILEASKNVFLTKREGDENGIIALEIEGKDGFVDLDDEYYDILNEKTVSGKVELKPYDALFLKEIK